MQSGDGSHGHRKTLPIKRADAEPLTREDVQFDLLHHIFSDPTRAFDDQCPCYSTAQPVQGKVTFGQLYVNILSRSFKLSKVIKDKMADSPAFALEFAKFALLTNVGRINTTMAFFPEMKTALRSYHPVPSLQKTDGNVQDAPRIKNCLKGASLPGEVKVYPPTTPAEVLERLNAGQRPPTSVVNLIFVLLGHASTLGASHFEAPLDVADLFLPINVPSQFRARAFLWLVYRYLEGPSRPNPFDDEYSRAHFAQGKAPSLPVYPKDRLPPENVDPPDEVEWGRQMAARRSKFLTRLVEEERTGPAGSSRQQRPTPQPPQPPPKLRPGARPPTQYAPPAPSSSTTGWAPRNPQPQPYGTYPAPIPAGQERTMFQHAWQTVLQTDPLVDSDDEQYPDQHHRIDYERRLQVLSRLRGKPPTPDTPNQADPSGPSNRS